MKVATAFVIVEHFDNGDKRMMAGRTGRVLCFADDLVAAARRDLFAAVHPEKRFTVGEVAP